MSDTAQTILLGVFTLATSIWVGGYIAIAVVAHVAARALPPAERVAFFRSLGRTYGILGSAALVVALGTGGALLSDRRWDAMLTAAVAVAAALVMLTVAGMAQARRMTRLRRSSLQLPDGLQLAAKVTRGAHTASALRALIGLLSLTLVVLGSLLAT